MPDILRRSPVAGIGTVFVFTMIRGYRFQIYVDIQLDYTVNCTVKKLQVYEQPFVSASNSQNTSS